MKATQEVVLETTKEATVKATQDGITTTGVVQEATEESKRTVTAFKEEDEMKLVEFLRDNELLHKKRLMEYKDPNKREALRNSSLTT